MANRRPQIPQIEAIIGMGQVEELIRVAEDELALIPKYAGPSRSRRAPAVLGVPAHARASGLPSRLPCRPAAARATGAILLLPTTRSRLPAGFPVLVLRRRMEAVGDHRRAREPARCRELYRQRMTHLSRPRTPRSHRTRMPAPLRPASTSIFHPRRGDLRRGDLRRGATNERTSGPSLR